MGREFELKYRATPAQIAAIREAFAEFREISMETTYFDTPDRRLSSRKWTLRLRMESGNPVCTLKTPDIGGGRGEWETECDNIASAIPELCKLGAPEELLSLTESGLQAVCGARFTRLARLVETPGCTVELALDHGALLGGGREETLCEVEVELKDGSENAAVAFAKALAANYGLTPESHSKYRRALALAKKA